MAAAGAGAGAGAAAAAGPSLAPTLPPPVAVAAPKAAKPSKPTVPRGFRWWMGFLHLTSVACGVIFAVLCYFVWADFDRIADAVEDEREAADASRAAGNATDVPRIGLRAFEELFTGAAVSAAFALIGVCGFAVLTSVPMWCGMGKPLSGPKRKFWRGLICGASVMLAFLLFVVAQQFLSLEGVARGLSDEIDGNFNVTLLQSTYVFGFIAGIFMTLFGAGLFFWRTPEVKKTVTY